MIELTVVLKDSERSYRQKFLVYDTVVMEPLNELILKCIEEAKRNFRGEPEDIQIKTLMVIL